MKDQNETTESTESTESTDGTQDHLNFPRTALITGASRGLGRALASALAARGSRVVLVARDANRLATAVDEIRRATNGEGEVHGVVGDVADKESIHRIAGAAAALVGPIELLVNNASSLGPVPLRPLVDTECEHLEEALVTNVLGAFRLTKVIVGAMLLRGRGVVLNLSSDAAVEAYEGWGAYGASKAALDHLSRIWAAELVDSGVHLYALDPGEMRTDMHRDAIPDADESTLQDPADVAVRFLRLVEILAHGQRPLETRLSSSALAAFISEEN